jgi:predicted nucleic acid-binding Zn ribbon protein
MDNGLLLSCSHKLSDAVSDKLAGLRMDSTNPRRRVRAMKGAISPIRDAWNVQGSAAPARTAGHAIETVFVCGLRASEWLVRLVGLERPQWSFGHAQWQKVGSLQPILVFCPCPNPIPRHAQPLCSQQLRTTLRVTRKVKRRVMILFHARFTLPRCKM